ncbi:MAG: hypothetical protein K940chlam8_00147 [Chlamydiae bacterium]|nr:hypothetical protein [Chlamydiota bacterium]
MSNASPIAAGFKEDLNHSQLQATIVSMAMQWNKMEGDIIKGNAICTQMLNKFAERITADMNRKFNIDIINLKTLDRYNPKSKNYSPEEVQKNIGIMMAEINKLQSVAQSNVQTVTGISDDTSNKVKQDISSAQSLITSASTIDTTVYQAAQQAANGISA